MGEKCSPEVIIEDVDPGCFREKVLVGLDCSAVIVAEIGVQCVDLLTALISPY